MQIFSFLARTNASKNDRAFNPNMGVLRRRQSRVTASATSLRRFSVKLYFSFGITARHDYAGRINSAASDGEEYEKCLHAVEQQSAQPHGEERGDCIRKLPIEELSQLSGHNKKSAQ